MEFTARRRRLMQAGITEEVEVKSLYMSMLKGESGEAVENKILERHGLIPKEPKASRRVKGEEDVIPPPKLAPTPMEKAMGSTPPPLMIGKIPADFWNRKASANDVVAWVVRNFFNPDLTVSDFPDPSALTLMATARNSVDAWQSVFSAYQKMVSSKTDERPDDGRIDGQREYDLLARFQELEAAP